MLQDCQVHRSGCTLAVAAAAAVESFETAAAAEAHRWTDSSGLHSSRTRALQTQCGNCASQMNQSNDEPQMNQPLLAPLLAFPARFPHCVCNANNSTHIHKHLKF